MPAPRRAKQPQADPTYYPVDDDMGEGLLHRLIGELLRVLVERWLARKRKRALVGANQFIYYEQYNPKACVAPDVYVLEGVDPATDVKSWKVWERGGVVPSLAIEIVSDDLQKDYGEALERYEAMGVPEVVIFDPHSERHRDRIRWQVWRRVRRGFRQVEVSDADRVRSKVLGCWLRMVGSGNELRVRLATGPRGDTLLPTESEEERQRAEQERRRAEQERRRAEQERQRAEAAEREVARLREELARAKRKR